MDHRERQVLSERLVGRNPAFVEEINKIPLLAKCSSSVLISGETGTGKEICARLVHELSKRSAKPFVAVNCGAIPVQLAENELFGHADGAFTGALRIKHGLIREAEGGTLFLDEVDSLPFSAQVKMLRFLQDKTYRPLGTAKQNQADVRVVAACGLRFEEIPHSGRIRNDLYYRLNVLPLRLPPLRERREDIPLLAAHFLRKFSTESGKRIEAFSSGAVQKLLFYDWPGNVRELSHVVERAVAVSESRKIRAGDLALPHTLSLEPLKQAKQRFVLEFERKYLQNVLSRCNGNISQAARAVNKNRRAFWQLIRKHDIDVRNLREGYSAG
ncbi:MAG: sigma-54 dependent transcriptional regulator [Syntrophobacteraceae bacterium]